ncbi:MAG TPA: hypothetical protein PKA64_17590, partial [Myxococcota bacterium]|nr:hypothetical protein [Myxococcota bacterium]
MHSTGRRLGCSSMTRGRRWRYQYIMSSLGYTSLSRRVLSTPGGQTIHVHVHNAVVGNEQQIVRVVKTALGSAARGGVGYARG